MKFSLMRPVKVVMLGAGGTGGHIAPHLYRLLYALDRPVRFIICDGDVVEEKNLVRQNFIPADLGENKAKVLAERYASVFGMETEYVPEFIENEERLRRLLEPGTFRMGYNWNDPVFQEQVILIGAVDNNRSRQLCHSVFYQMRELVYIDSGNGEYTGQVVCGIRSGGRTLYRPIGKVYPDVLKEKDKFPTRPPEHCGQYHGGHRRGGHDLQHSGSGRQQGAAGHLCHDQCEYAAHAGKDEEEKSGMKETGIIRRMDDLGRIVIPKEVRRLLNLREGDALELFLHEQGVFYKKYDPAKPVKACLATLKEAVMDEPALECSEEVMQKISELEDLLARE